MESADPKKASALDWLSSLSEVINFRSFSNLWYWIMLAVMWSSVSHWVLGVPYDLVIRAAKQGGQAEEDLADILRVNVNRLIYIAEMSGIWIIAFGAFFLSFLVLSGFVYGFQLAQAVFLLAFPMSLIGFMSFRMAHYLKNSDLTGPDLRRTLTRHRTLTQVIGMVSIFFTALWGMYQNLAYMMPNHVL